MRISGTRGSGLVVVMMLCLATLILVGSFLRTMAVQGRIGYRAILGTEARNAAEGSMEYALAEMHRRAAADPSFGGSTGAPLGTYTLPSADLTFLAPGTGYNHVVSSEVSFKGGVLSDRPATMMLIDDADPVNFMDPQKGQSLIVRSMNLFGKAQVTDPNNSSRPVTSYVAANVQIREQAWFNYAVFYNMDMEFHSATTMDIYGPVHSNADIYAAAGGSNELRFFSTLTSFKRILRKTKYTGDTSTHSGTVKCIDAPGMLTANLSAMSTSRDSLYSGFKSYATTEWKGFVQDQSFTVPRFDPPGLPAYVPDDLATTSTNELRNGAYVMIEPQLSKVTSDTDYGYKTLAAENLKFSALSGFVIQVSAPTSTNPTTLPALGTPTGTPLALPVSAQPRWKIVVYQAGDTSHILSADNPPARDTTTGKPIVSTIIDPFLDLDETQTTVVADQKMKRALKQALLNAIVSIPYGDAGTTATLWGNGFSALRLFTPPSNAWAAPYATTGTYYPIYDRREGYIYPNAIPAATDGLKGAMHVLQIDLTKLKALLNDTTDLWRKPDDSGWVYNVAANYSGVVYVQFPLAPIDTTRFPSPVGSNATGDMIRAAQYPVKAVVGTTPGTPGYALRMVNCQTVPQLTSGTPDGFTIATNGPAYVLGHFNADGNSATGSETAPDSAAEGTAMIAADAVTLLSPGFTGNDQRDMATTKPSASAFTEVSAAIVTGLVPTQPGVNKIWAGGVHNFIRFHEDWSGVTYRYRGSIAALFESEVAKKPWHQNSYVYWYEPPTRDVGYHQYLARGRFPPGTPVKRTVRRMSMQDISETTYNAGPTKPPVAN